jgi:hypothetical protein
VFLLFGVFFYLHCSTGIRARAPSASNLRRMFFTRPFSTQPFNGQALGGHFSELFRTRLSRKRNVLVGWSSQRMLTKTTESLVFLHWFLSCEGVRIENGKTSFSLQEPTNEFLSTSFRGNDHILYSQLISHVSVHAARMANRHE